MYLLPTSEQEQIVDAAKAFLAGEAPVERLRPDIVEIGNNDHLLWPQLGELGFWGLSVPEEAGGVGLSLNEEYLLYREFGRHLVSLGALGLTLGARIAALAGLTDAAATMIAGNTRVAIANPRGAAGSSAEGGAGSYHLFEGRGAEWVILWSEAGAALYPIGAFHIVEDVLAMDSHMTLLRAELEPGAPAAYLDAGVDDIRLRAFLLIAAYGVGMCEATRDMAVEYAKIREQFGQPIGKFQAVKHRCAEMAIRTEVAYCQATYAALALSENLADKRLQVVSAKLLAVDSALRNGADNIQTHGAFGFTAEGDAHLYLKRAHTIDFLGGTLREQKAEVLRQPVANPQLVD